MVARTSLTITDNGPGIAASDTTEIFRPRFTTKTDGTGVGLSLARLILRGHGRDLSLASSGPGATMFESTLPA